VLLLRLYLASVQTESLRAFADTCIENKMEKCAEVGSSKKTSDMDMMKSKPKTTGESIDSSINDEAAAPPSPNHSPPPAKPQLPMIPVPLALQIVLTETARSIYHQEASHVSVSSHEMLLGRASAEDLRAPEPGYLDYNASIMDGYAIRTGDLDDARTQYGRLSRDEKKTFVLSFDLVGRVYAGDDGAGEIASSKRPAIYITTGAVVPDGYDAVVPIEETEAKDSSTVQIVSSHVESVLDTKPMTWVRPIGCDIAAGSVVLARGEIVQPVHVALAAQVGLRLADIKVRRLPRIGVLSTGNELTPAFGQPTKIGQGKIPDVNRPMLLTQLAAYGNCIPVDLGIVSDEDSSSISKLLDDALWSESCTENVDVLVTTGGISMGEKDVMAKVFVEGMNGKLHFGRMNMKPGKPTTFITIDRKSDQGAMRRKLIFALPGNPVSASVCTELLVRPCLDLIHDSVASDEDEESFVNHGADHARVHEEVMAELASDIKLDQGRPEYRRVALRRVASADGPSQYTYQATSTGVQRSSRVMSLRGADGLMILPRGGSRGCGFDVATKGMQFPVLLLRPLSSNSRTCFKDSMHHASWKSKSESRQQNQKSNLRLGIIICQPEGQNRSGDVAEILSKLGPVEVSTTCELPKTGELGNALRDAINGADMKDTNTIFVVVPSSTNRIFKLGIEVSHCLRQVISKPATSVALKMRKIAASCDKLAGLFENTVGTVRDGSAVVVSCTDIGLAQTADSMKPLLCHTVSLLDR